MDGESGSTPLIQFSCSVFAHLFGYIAPVMPGDGLRPAMKIIFYGRKMRALS